MSVPAVINFWFEFASPYSMITALRLFHALTNTPPPTTLGQTSASCVIPDLRNIQIIYRPISLGRVFKAVGQNQLPNTTVPRKGLYLFHDVQRTLNIFGYPGFPASKPSTWPPNSTLAGRMTWMLSQGPEYVRSLDSGRNSLVEQAGLGGEWIGGLAEFVWRVYEAEFIGSEDIGSAEVMARLWDAVVARPGRNDGQEGVWPDGGRAVVLASEETVKDGFRRCSDAAVQSGVFGAPTFTTDDGDLYWGNDRLLDAINHHSVRDAIGQNAGFSLRTKGANL